MSVLEVLNRAIHELESERARKSEELAQIDCILAALRDQRQLPMLHEVQEQWVAHSKADKNDKNS